MFTDFAETYEKDIQKNIDKGFEGFEGFKGFEGFEAFLKVSKVSEVSKFSKVLSYLVKMKMKVYPEISWILQNLDVNYKAY